MAIRVLVAMTVKQGRASEFEAHMATVVARMREGEPGLLDVAWGKADLPDQFGFTARYQDEAAYEFHKASPWESEARPTTAALIEIARTQVVTFREA